jgi:hypothetical protein
MHAQGFTLCSAIIQSGITQSPFRAIFVVVQLTGPDSFAAKQGLPIYRIECCPEILWQDGATSCKLLSSEGVDSYIARFLL